MESVESCVPPGFRFHPTDEELVGYYLRKKVASQKIDLDVIRDVDLYRIEPWDLREHCKIGYEEQSEWYFFSYKDRKYPTGTRTNRATMVGFWKATGRDKAVFDKGKLIGMRKTLVFYKGRAPNGQKSDWIIHEYRLESDENGPPQEEGWVVCRAFKKRAAYPCRSAGSGAGAVNDLWDVSGYFFADHSFTASTAGSVAGTSRRHMPCWQPPLPLEIGGSTQIPKCETEAEQLDGNGEGGSVSLLHYASQLLELPQLDSPGTGPAPPPPAARRAAGDNYAGGKDKAITMTDWRALDRFVASQLSAEDQGRPAVDAGEDMAKLMVLHSSPEEEDLEDGSWSGSGLLGVAGVAAAGRGDRLGACVFSGAASFDGEDDDA